MRELRGSGRVTVKHIPGETNPADLFTKIQASPAFQQCEDSLLKKML